jgi:predicted ATP-grasp superfamily ATP-dependent carboligase
VWTFNNTYAATSTNCSSVAWGNAATGVVGSTTVNFLADNRFQQKVASSAVRTIFYLKLIFFQKGFLQVPIDMVNNTNDALGQYSLIFTINLPTYFFYRISHN